MDFYLIHLCFSYLHKYNISSCILEELLLAWLCSHHTKVISNAFKSRLRDPVRRLKDTSLQKKSEKSHKECMGLLLLNFISAASSEILNFRRRMLVHQYCTLLILIQKQCSVVVSVAYYKFTTFVGSIKLISKTLKQFLVKCVCRFDFMRSSFIYTSCQEDVKYPVLAGVVLKHFWLTCLYTVIKLCRILYIWLTSLQQDVLQHHSLVKTFEKSKTKRTF